MTKSIVKESFLKFYYKVLLLSSCILDLKKKNKLKGRISEEIGPRDIFIFMIKSENGNSCRFMSLPYLCNNYRWLVRAELSRWWCLVIIGWIGFTTQRDSHFTGEQAEVEWFNQVKRIEKSVFNRFFIAIFSRFWGF